MNQHDAPKHVHFHPEKAGGPRNAPTIRSAVRAPDTLVSEGQARDYYKHEALPPDRHPLVTPGGSPVPPLPRAHKPQKGPAFTPRALSFGAGSLILLFTAVVIGEAIRRNGEKSDEPIKPEPPRKGPPPRLPQPRPTTYTVQRLDRPHLIAHRFLGADYNTKRPAWWPELQQANPGKPLAAPDRWRKLAPGEVLTIPAAWGPPPSE